MFILQNDETGGLLRTGLNRCSNCGKSGMSRRGHPYAPRCKIFRRRLIAHNVKTFYRANHDTTFPSPIVHRQVWASG